MAGPEDLASLFFATAATFPDRPALEIGDHSYSYAELRHAAVRFATTLLTCEDDTADAVGVLAPRVFDAFAGVLGILAAGKSYVALNPELPLSRLQTMIDVSGTRVIVLAAQCSSIGAQLLSQVQAPCTVIMTDERALLALAPLLPQHRMVLAKPARQSWQLPRDLADRPAYIVFTSGSTGRPKAIQVRHRHVIAYVTAIAQRCDFSALDRFSQTAELSFDLSVHDLFVCWSHGGSLCVIGGSSLLAAVRIVRERALTIWCSVPSLIGLVHGLGLLKPQSMPSLRHSFFCGEPLTISAARLWQQAASNSVVENLYGPAETTVAVTSYRWEASSEPQPSSDVVPIGYPLAGTRLRVVDEQLQSAPVGQAGELCIGGPQVSDGYLHDPQRTAERFVALPGTAPERWYRTGDVVRADEAGCLHFIGRRDCQIKMRGFRIELEEIDRILQRFAATELALAVAWPAGGAAEAIYGFIAGDFDEAEVRRGCAAHLPRYMVPTEIFSLASMPRNASGKMDRIALAGHLQRILETPGAVPSKARKQGGCG